MPKRQECKNVASHQQHAIQFFPGMSQRGRCTSMSLAVAQVLSSPVDVHGKLGSKNQSLVACGRKMRTPFVAVYVQSRKMLRRVEVPSGSLVLAIQGDRAEPTAREGHRCQDLHRHERSGACGRGEVPHGSHALGGFKKQNPRAGFITFLVSTQAHCRNCSPQQAAHDRTGVQGPHFDSPLVSQGPGKNRNQSKTNTNHVGSDSAAGKHAFRETCNNMAGSPLAWLAPGWRFCFGPTLGSFLGAHQNFRYGLLRNGGHHMHIFFNIYIYRFVKL